MSQYQYTIPSVGPASSAQSDGTLTRRQRTDALFTGDGSQLPTSGFSYTPKQTQGATHPCLSCRVRLHPSEGIRWKGLDETTKDLTGIVHPTCLVTQMKNSGRLAYNTPADYHPTESDCNSDWYSIARRDMRDPSKHSLFIEGREKTLSADTPAIWSVCLACDSDVRGRKCLSVARDWTDPQTNETMRTMLYAHEDCLTSVEQQKQATRDAWAAQARAAQPGYWTQPQNSYYTNASVYQGPYQGYQGAPQGYIAANAYDPSGAGFQGTQNPYQYGGTHYGSQQYSGGQYGGDQSGAYPSSGQWDYYPPQQ